MHLCSSNGLIVEVNGDSPGHKAPPSIHAARVFNSAAGIGSPPRRHERLDFPAGKLVNKAFFSVAGDNCGTALAPAQSRLPHCQIELALGYLGVVATKTPRFKNRHAVGIVFDTNGL